MVSPSFEIELEIQVPSGFSLKYKFRLEKKLHDGKRGEGGPAEHRVLVAACGASRRRREAPAALSSSFSS